MKFQPRKAEFYPYRVFVSEQEMETIERAVDLASVHYEDSLEESLLGVCQDVVFYYSTDPLVEVPPATSRPLILHLNLTDAERLFLIRSGVHLCGDTGSTGYQIATLCRRYVNHAESTKLRSNTQKEVV